MSTIRKTPYVETLIGGLSSADKATLLTLVNGSGTNVAASISNLPTDNVKAVNFEFDNGEVKSALYVHTTNNTALLCYHRFQDLLVLEIDSNHNINKINEYLDINELRRILTESIGGGIVYTAGNGIDITSNVISVDDDLTIDNVFANEEIEFSDNSGDFGTNAAARIDDRIDTKIASKQDTLVSGTNIKTINNNSLLGSGNISISTDPEGTDVKSTNETSGKVLTANGSGGSAWVYPSASNFNSGSATSGQVLTANGSGGATWQTGSAGMTNPMTTQGDIIVGGASGTPARLGIGTAGQFLSVNSDASGLTWATGGGGGSSLYRHYIILNDTLDNQNSRIIEIINNIQSAFSVGTLKQYFTDNNITYYYSNTFSFTNSSGYCYIIPDTYVEYNGTNIGYTRYYGRISNNGISYVNYDTPNYITVSTLLDTVTQLS